MLTFHCELSHLLNTGTGMALSSNVYQCAYSSNKEWNGKNMRRQSGRRAKSIDMSTRKERWSDKINTDRNLKAFIYVYTELVK